MPTKAELRAAALLRRDALPPSLRQAHTHAILEAILATDDFRQAQTIMAYCSFGSELDTTPLLQAIRDQHKALALPRVNQTTATLDVYQVNHLHADLLSGPWGIREPNPGTCLAQTLQDIDLILVPGVAFDRHGGRIGYGKGYYDQLLTAPDRPPTLAGAFEAQVIEAVPMAPHDVPIDTLVTEAGFWRRPNRAM